MRQYSAVLSFVVCAAFSLFALTSSADAQMDVFLDFDADWEININDAASSAGVDAFSAGEISLIESNIETQVNSMFSEFLITFSTTSPGGSFTRIDFGAGGSSALGSAPLDYFNLSVNQTANMFVDNFDFIIDEFSGSTNRAQQIDQISTAIAGTAAHELGHTIGLHHHHSYSNFAINPGNYNSTGGAQNAHILATGSTGLGEVGRQTQRTLSPWSKLIMEAAGGLHASRSNSGTALANTVLAEQLFNGSDVGDTTGTAEALGTGQDLPISGYNQAFNAFSEITNGDEDVFAIDILGPGTLTAEVVSQSRWGDSFDTVIELIDIDGTTVLGTNTDGSYSGNTYGSGGSGVNDSFLINFELDEAGTYYLRVSSEGGTGDYSLLIGAVTSPIPEPGSVIVLLGISGLILVRRRRRG